ncbi:MAG TPA: hypothetical protein VLG16_02790 [Candidatus Saccharimonadales bacterium]|nr:hypothetical protein [Candidatus Saccharimonadales bacterium]
MHKDVPKWHPEIPRNGAPKFSMGSFQGELDNEPLMLELDEILATVYEGLDMPVPQSPSARMVDILRDEVSFGVNANSPPNSEPELEIEPPEPDLPPDEKTSKP